MTGDIYSIAFIVPGRIEMDQRLRELLSRYDTDNQFQEDFRMFPYLDLAAFFLSAGATIATAPVAGMEDTVAFAHQLMIHEGTEDRFYGVLEDILDEMFLPKEPTPIPTPDPKRRFQVLKGGRA